MSRILIAGLGSIGRRHLRNLACIEEHTIVLYRTHPIPVEEAPKLPVYTDISEALSTQPDLVIVSTPTAHHVSVALAAVRAGCNVFIEKPLSHTWGGVDELVKEIQGRGLLSLMGFDLRFDPGLCKVKGLLEEGLIGRVVSIQAQVGQYLPDWHPWEDYRKGVSASSEMGGGVILDLIHELDYVTWLLGPVSELACFAGHASSLEIQTEDTAAILLQFENGAIGTVHLDYLQRAPSRTCRIIGEDGTILWDYHAQQVRWYKAGKDEWEEFAYPDCQRNDRFLSEMKHVLACLAGQDQPRADVTVGRQVLRLALAAKESALTGERVRVSS
ncbi:MAG: Gfo/Idh/MocA family oxidoreductase [Nitrospirae bacterium]|nr:Gfo/Idh/MocA family oxidoreductase [Nitrospirota bacterium]